MDTLRWLSEWRCNDGFDRQGSHSAGEYVEYEFELQRHVPEHILAALADAIDERFVIH